MPIPIVSGPYRTFRALNAYESFIEYEGSTITIPMQGRRSADGSWLKDTLKLKAFMRLEIFPAYVNNLGTREFQFIIRDWELYGTSPMLNQLFYDDPRGQFVEDPPAGVADYLPAMLTFQVSHDYHIEADGSDQTVVSELFAGGDGVEIRNLNSHHLRVWTRQGDAYVYSNPSNRIYWQIVPGSLVAETGSHGLFVEAEEAKDRQKSEDGHFILFHKKAPGLPDEEAGFDLRRATDRARYLIAGARVAAAKTVLLRGRDRLAVTATLPARGFAANLNQLTGNAVASSGLRSRLPLEIRLALAPTIESGDHGTEVLSKLLSDTERLPSGSIRLVSPARSLGTADQAPDHGYPFDSADFPARITYAINYDIFINQHQFVADQAGIAIAVGTKEVPPRDVKVAFEKPHAGNVVGAYLNFANGDCTGMDEITQDEFLAGVNYSRYWRTMPLALERGGGALRDYDPAFQY